MDDLAIAFRGFLRYLLLLRSSLMSKIYWLKHLKAFQELIIQHKPKEENEIKDEKEELQ